MRTIRRVSVEVNKGKLKGITDLITAYCNEKDQWLVYLHSNISDISQFRKVRDGLVKSKYNSPYGLSSTHWKNAVEDACKQMDMYWQALLVDVRKKISRNVNCNWLNRIAHIKLKVIFQMIH